MKKTIRKMQLGGLLSMLIIGAAFWQFLLSPLMDVPTQLAEKEASLSEQYKQKDVRLLELSTTAANYDDEKAQAEALNVRIPQSMEEYSFIDQISTLASSAGLPPSSVETTVTGSLKPVERQDVAASEVFSAAVSITARNANPGVLVEFANDLHDAERVISMAGMTIEQDSENGGYVLTVAGSMYAAPLLDTEPAMAGSTTDEPQVVQGE